MVTADCFWDYVTCSKANFRDTTNCCNDRYKNCCAFIMVDHKDDPTHPIVTQSPPTEETTYRHADTLSKYAFWNGSHAIPQ